MVHPHDQDQAAEGDQAMNRTLILSLFLVSLIAFLLYSPGTYSPGTVSSHESMMPESPQAAQTAMNSSIDCVFISSSLPGQSQYLSVPQNTSGALLYPDLSIKIIASVNSSYDVYIDGKIISSGNVSGIKDIPYVIPNGTSKVSISVGVGQTDWNFPNEVVSSIPVSKYYGPKPPAALYTYYEYEVGIAKGFIAGIFGVAIAMFSGRKYVLEKEKREAIFI